MFPERPPKQTADNCFTIYRGQKAICAIQLVAHCYYGKWRYILKADDTLNVQLRNSKNEIIIQRILQVLTWMSRQNRCLLSSQKKKRLL